MSLSSSPACGPSSRLVDSDQTGVHSDLLARVSRHRNSAFQRPPHAGSVAAFEQAKRHLTGFSGRKLVLDAGCGTGLSTRKLAAAQPGSVVIGIDKSAHRLRRGTVEPSPENALLLRANVLDFYPLARAAGWQCAAQYLLYPNPWPKAAHLNKRWHGSPVFSDLIALGGSLEMRCNWRIYADEMALALAQFGVDCRIQRYRAEVPLTRFEAKYRDSGHVLWRLQADLSTTL